MDNHSELSKSLSYLIERHIPEFVSRENPAFMTFMEAYFQWMEQEGNAQELITEFENYKDIDKTVDGFIDYFRKMYFENIPANVLADKRLLAKHIRDLYKSKGTIPGYKLLFRILYNENVELFYPGDDVLRASDGRWIEDKLIYLTNSTVTDFSNLKISGRQSGATAIVETSAKIENRVHIVDSSAPEYIVQCYLSNIIGEFVKGEQVDILDYDGSVVSTNTVYSIYTGFSIESEGLNYEVDDVARVYDWASDTSIATGKVINIGVDGKIRDIKMDSFSLDIESTKRETDFSNKTLPEFIEVKRNSVGSYIDSNKLLKFANANEPRFTHSPVTGDFIGLLNEGTSTNRILYSNTLTNTTSFSVTGINISQESTLNSPEGEKNAWKIVESTDNSIHTVSVQSASVENGKQYVFSLFVKKNTPTTKKWIQLLGFSNLGSPFINFNIETGEIGTTMSTVSTFNGGGIIDYGDWWRVYMAFTATSTTTGGPVFGLVGSGTSGRKGSSYVGDGSETWVYGVQLEEGNVPSSYIPCNGTLVTRDDENITLSLYYPNNQLTYEYSNGISNYVEVPHNLNYELPVNVINTNQISNLELNNISGYSLTRSGTGTSMNVSGKIAVVASNQARYEYDSITHARKGLIIEPQKTNKIVGSQAVVTTNSNYTVLNGTLSTTTVSSIFDAENWSMFLENTTSGEHKITTKLYSSSNTTQCFSAYVKPINKRYIVMCPTGLGGVTTTGAIFDLQNKSVVSYTGLLNAAIVDLGNDVYRISCAAQSTSSTGTVASLVIQSLDASMNTSFAGSTSNGFYISGIQWEESVTSPTSLIKTTTSANATRVEDFLTGFPYSKQNIIITFVDNTTQTFYNVASNSTIGGSKLSKYLIKNIQFVEFPYTSNKITYVSVDNPILFEVVSNTGTGASISPVVGVIGSPDGRWEGTYGQLSSDKKMQDNFYYQDYSYVLRSNVEVDEFRNIVKELVHPAGFQLFGELFSEESSINDVILTSNLSAYVYKIIERIREIVFTASLQNVIVKHLIQRIIQYAFKTCETFDEVMLLQRMNMNLSEYQNIVLKSNLNSINESLTPNISVYGVGSLTARPAIYFNRNISSIKTIQ